MEYPQATIVVANSWIHGSPAGYFGPDQLAWIDRTLGARPDVPALVCLHHPPLPVGIPFLDGMILTDAAGLATSSASTRTSSGCWPGTRTRRLRPVRRHPDDRRASTYRQSALRMHDAEAPGYVADPTSFLLHVLDGSSCVTHSVAVSHAAAVRAF